MKDMKKSENRSMMQPWVSFAWVLTVQCEHLHYTSYFIFFHFIVPYPREDNYMFLLIIITGRLCLLPLVSRDNRNSTVGCQELLGCFALHHWQWQKWSEGCRRKEQRSVMCSNMGRIWVCVTVGEGSVRIRRRLPSLLKVYNAWLALSATYREVQENVWSTSANEVRAILCTTEDAISSNRYMPRYCENLMWRLEYKLGPQSCAVQLFHVCSLCTDAQGTATALG